jgi:hypothetical protein
MLLANLLSQSGATEECRRFLTTAQEDAAKASDFEMLTEIKQRLAAPESGTVTVSDGPIHLADL